ncbi:MAG: hypothetical protein AAF125_07350 [Chloroflexota bacterium]
MSYDVRQATLDDTRAISQLARARIGVWQRMDPTGKVQDVDYADLTVYDRWLHGGPWMSIETGALQLSRLLRGAGLSLVAVNGDTVLGYTEVYAGTEPQPYGRHLHIGVVHATDNTVRDSLLDAAIDQARQNRVTRLTANIAANDDDTLSYYQTHGFAQVDEIRRMTLAAKQGQVFYQATDDDSALASQIDGWYLNIGRLGSARYQWESLWPATYEAIPQIRERKTHRLHFNAAGNEAFVLVRQQLYIPRYADVFAWTPKPPTGQLITAIRDWAHREGYRKLVMPTATNSIKTLGLDAEPDGYREVVYALSIT